MQGHIDVHAHYFPSSYLDWLERFAAASAEGSVLARNMATECRRRARNFPGVTDLDQRLRDMDEVGIEVDVLSVGNIDVALAGADGPELARTANDALASACERFPDRFAALGCVALNDAEVACTELRRMREELSFAGVMVPTHVDGVPLEDGELSGFFALAAKLGMVVSVHPTVPALAGPPLEPYGLTPLIGFVADTGVAVLRMILSGMLDRHPGLTVVVPHMGGMLPYLARRLDDGWLTNHDAGTPLERKPSEYLLDFYFDTVHADAANVSCLVRKVGAERLLLGTDYPFFTGRAGVAATVEALEQLGVPEADRAAVCGGTAARLLQR
jgi:aminocarboxymuconate-semialdehyde decarboxylase